MTPLEIFAALVTILSIWLGTRQNVWYFPTGIGSVVLYAWLFFHAKLYAEAGLQGVWLALMLYGWYLWLHGGAGRSVLPVTRTPGRAWWAIAMSGLAMTAITVWLQHRFTDNPSPLVDSSIAAWSIVAQYMTAKKWLENWFVWMAVNVVAVPLYATRDLQVTALLYVVLLVLAVTGYRTWRATLRSRI